MLAAYGLVMDLVPEIRFSGTWIQLKIGFKTVFSSLKMKEFFYSTCLKNHFSADSGYVPENPVSRTRSITNVGYFKS